MLWCLVGPFLFRWANSSSLWFSIVGNYRVPTTQYLLLVRLLRQGTFYHSYISNFEVCNSCSTNLSFSSRIDSISHIYQTPFLFQCFGEHHYVKWRNRNLEHLQFLSWHCVRHQSLTKPDYPSHPHLHSIFRTDSIRFGVVSNNCSSECVRSFLQRKSAHTIETLHFLFSRSLSSLLPSPSLPTFSSLPSSTISSSSSSTPSTTTTTVPKPSRRKKVAEGVGITLGLALGLTAIAVVLFYCRKSRQQRLRDGEIKSEWRGDRMTESRLSRLSSHLSRRFVLS